MKTKLCRVLHVIEDASLTGGAQRQLLGLLLSSQIGRGYEAILASPEGELAEKARAAGIPFEFVHFNRRFSLATVRCLAGIVKRERVKIVHSHLPMSNLHVHAAALITRVPHVATLHGEAVAYTSRFIRFLSLARRTGICFVTVSGETARSIQSVIGGDHIPHIYNGIDMQSFASIKAMARDSAPPIIGCVGRLHPHKGQDILLRAFVRVLQEFPASRLALVGDGEERNQLQALARGLRLEKSVRFHGYLQDIQPLMATFTLCAVPSRREGFGIIILEAGAMHKPVVATNVGGIPEVLGGAENGLLVPAEDAEKLAEGLLVMLRDPDRARRMADSLHRRVREHFSIRRSAERYAELYTNLLSRKSQAGGG